MDLLRAAIKAMYYDYPIENAYGMIVGDDKVKNFLTHFNRLANMEDDGFTQREMTAYKDFLLETLREKWKRQETMIQPIVGMPYLFATEVLKKNADDYPCVDFQYLFRWREVVKCLGEDIFTTAFLAKADKTERKDFFWPNVIGHNDEKINAALDQGLSDIHCHFGGAIDSFQFNWICLMNDIDGLKDKFDKLQFSYNAVIAFDKEYTFNNMSKWCRVAAAIRVRLYKLLIKGVELNATEERKAIREIGKCSGDDESTTLKEDINALLPDAKRTRDGVILDYAIGEDLIPDKFATSPFGIYAGERQIEYAFYWACLNKQSTKVKIRKPWLEWFYLYELIKTHLRKEFIFANELSGLDYYNGYIARSELFSHHVMPICNVSSIQTSFRREKDDFIESRITSGTLSLATGVYWKSLFSDGDFLPEDELKKRLTFVVQFTKGWKDSNEHMEGRSRRKRIEIRDEFNKLTKFVDDNESQYQIVGIDAGGMELYYRPEIYGHVLRAGKKHGLRITYHVGEEFYDLADGLRAIWEIIEFAKIDQKDRLGHCLALGVLAREYYKRKHNTLTMPKQVMLDNLVWLCGFANEHQIVVKPALIKLLTEKATELYKELGYERKVGTLNMEAYYESMLLRSDEANDEDGQDIWSMTAVLDTTKANKARTNENALKLYQAYTLNEKIIENGEKPVTERINNDYVRLVMKIQNAMLWYVKKTEVCIETCPSSNLQIGKLYRYEFHPSVKYYLTPFSKNKKLNFAICTDDKGTFSTSLTNEFSLLALAATKGKGWSKRLEKDFAQLISQGNKYRFKTKTK